MMRRQIDSISLTILLAVLELRHGCKDQLADSCCLRGSQSPLTTNFACSVWMGGLQLSSLLKYVPVQHFPAPTLLLTSLLQSREQTVWATEEIITPSKWRWLPCLLLGCN